MHLHTPQGKSYLTRERERRLRDFPVHRALEFDSRRMGALSFGDFLVLADSTNMVFSEREKRRMTKNEFERKAASCFLFLDVNRDGLVSFLDSDRRGRINDISRVKAIYEPALRKGEQYGKNGRHEKKIIAQATKLYMDNKLESIKDSREAIEHAGTYIYKYSVPMLYLAPKQEGMTILHLSDIHFGAKKEGSEEQKFEFLHTLKDRIAQPDIIAITGDLVTDDAGDFSKHAAKALGGLFKKAVRVFVFGNHDIKYGATGIIKEALESFGYLDLTNQYFLGKVRGKPFSLSGVDDYRAGKPEFRDIPQEARLSPHVLVTHNLDAVDGTYPGCFDLVLTGHTHMGEKNFLVFDGYDFMKFFGIYKNINHQKDEWGVATQRTTFHITSGLGSHGQRVYTTPEGVSLITLVQG